LCRTSGTNAHALRSKSGVRRRSKVPYRNPRPWTPCQASHSRSTRCESLLCIAQEYPSQIESPSRPTATARSAPATKTRSGRSAARDRRERGRLRAKGYCPSAVPSRRGSAPP
jgi:hypothetical protein